MTKKVRWGVLSTANIGVKKVIPGMQRGQFSTVAAIASRDLARARTVAARLNIPTAYGSYEELLADPNIDAIYNPRRRSWQARPLRKANRHEPCRS